MPSPLNSTCRFSAMACAAFALALAAAPAGAQPASGTFSVKQLTPEAALAAARAALESCRQSGYQVAVAVTDRSGLTQVMLRDRFAGVHTVETAINKAWTAVSFRTHTTDLEKATRPGTSMAGIRNLSRATAIGGGLMIEAGGSMMGAIGVSGAPGGDADDICARAGLKAIADDLEF